jgi:hypothetical protein
MKPIKGILPILLIFLVAAFSCHKSMDTDHLLGSWVPVENPGNWNSKDTLKISRMEGNIFVELGGHSLAANVDDKNNRLDFEVSALGMHSKLSIVYVSKEDVLWLTGGVNGKKVFKRAS